MVIFISLSVNKLIQLENRLFDQTFENESHKSPWFEANSNNRLLIKP